jgi:hypothetical protein
MPYGKGKYSKRVNTTKAKYKTSARSQSKQIVKLQKQVDKLDIKTKDMYISAYFSNGDSFKMYDGLGPIGSGTGNIPTNPTFYIRELFKPALLEPVFTTTAAFNENQKVRIKSMIYKGKLGISPTINPANDPNSPDIVSPAVTPTYIQMWIVTLKKETGRQLMNETENMDQDKFNTLANGGPFSVQNVNVHIGDGNIGRRGNAMLNPAFFNIRSYRSFTMGNDVETYTTNTPVSNISDVAKSFSIKIPMNNLVKSGAGGSPWKSLIPGQLQTQDRIWCIYSVCRPYSGVAAPNGELPNQSGINISSNVMFKILGSQ